MRRLRALVLAAAIAGCAAPPPPVTPPDPTARPTAAPATARPTAAPTAVATPTAAPAGPAASVPPAGARAVEDRPDEAAGFQVHLVYVLAADGDDRRRDQDDTIADAMDAAARWMEGQTGGARLRVDTYGGRPDITFRRLPRTEAQLGTEAHAIVDAVHAAGEAAGDTHPQKAYAYFYDGPVGPKDAGTSVLGLGGSGRATVLMDAVDEGDRALGLVAQHELIHALEAIRGCSKAMSADGHTTDDPHDLMAATYSEDPVLDPGHDDYYGTPDLACPDLARSLFLEPLPAAPFVPANAPLALAAPAGAAPVGTDGAVLGASGIAEAEAALLAAIAARRDAAGLPALIVVPALAAAARAYAPGGAAVDPRVLAAAAGYPGFVGAYGFSAPTTDGLVPAAAGGKEGFTWATTEARLRHVGVGVVRSGGFSYAGILGAYAQLNAADASIGDGPRGTRTFAVRVTPVDGAPVRAGLRVDRQLAQPFVRAIPAGGLVLTATLPATGDHAIDLFTATDAAYTTEAAWAWGPSKGLVATGQP